MIILRTRGKDTARNLKTGGKGMARISKIGGKDPARIPKTGGKDLASFVGIDVFFEFSGGEFVFLVSEHKDIGEILRCYCYRAT